LFHLYLVEAGFQHLLACKDKLPTPYTLYKVYQFTLWMVLQASLCVFASKLSLLISSSWTTINTPSMSSQSAKLFAWHSTLNGMSTWRL
jgi:hypothetical protein